MSIHYAILTDLPNSPKEVATIDVVTDAPIGVQWSVFVAGVPTTSNILNTADPSYFAASAQSSIPNLFTPSGTTLCLVRAMTVDGNGNFAAIPSRALLKQRSGTTKVILNLPPSVDNSNNVVGVGSTIAFAMGGLAQGATLFVAAIDGPADFTIGLGSAAPTGPFHLDAFNVQAIPMTQQNTRVTIQTQGAGQQVCAILAIDTGKVDETTLLAC